MWKERGSASRKDQHKVKKEQLIIEARVISEEEEIILVWYRFLFKPGLEKLRKSTLSRIQYWVEKSGGIIRQWRTKYNSRKRTCEGEKA